MAIELEPDMVNSFHETPMGAIAADKEARLEAVASQFPALEVRGEEEWWTIFCLTSKEMGSPSQRPSHRPLRFQPPAQRRRRSPHPDAGKAFSHPLTPRTAALHPRLPRFWTSVVSLLESPRIKSIGEVHRMALQVLLLCHQRLEAALGRDPSPAAAWLFPLSCSPRMANPKSK